MPEGHTIHRYARQHREALAGRRVTAWSPQGRFRDGARLLDGTVLEDVAAYGKHLIYRFSGDLRLHVHLGLFGRFGLHRACPPPPTAGTRLALRAADTTLYLAGPTICAVINRDEESAIRARLGPDPLDPAADPERMWAGLQRRSVGIGHALLDQKLVAGIGNVYRAEALFVCGIDPDRPASTIARHEFEALWGTLVRMLAEGERSGEIVTAAGGFPAQGCRRTGAVPDPDARRYVYGRGGEPCHCCGTPVRVWQLGGRTVSACPRCQPSSGTSESMPYSGHEWFRRTPTGADRHHRA